MFLVSLTNAQNDLILRVRILLINFKLDQINSGSLFLSFVVDVTIWTN